MKRPQVILTGRRVTDGCEPRQAWKGAAISNFCLCRGSIPVRMTWGLFVLSSHFSYLRKNLIFTFLDKPFFGLIFPNRLNLIVFINYKNLK